MTSTPPAPIPLDVEPPDHVSRTGRLLLAANIIGVGCHPGAWRYSPRPATTFVSLDHVTTIAQIAEEGGFDAVFMADVPALREDIGVRPPQVLDPTVTLGAIAASTSRIGLIGTASTTYEEPYNLARRFASLHQLSGGRAGWNVVSTAHPHAPGNFGRSHVPTAEARYDRAEEVLAAVRTLWETWEPQALIGDVGSGRFADTERIHPAGFEGHTVSVTGPLNMPVGPDRPLIVQAGTSARGQLLGASTADAIFCPGLTLEDARDLRDRIRLIARRVRPTGHMPALLPGVVTVIAPTRDAAHSRLDALQECSDLDENRARLARLLFADPEELLLDEPVPEKLFAPGRNLEGTTGFLHAISAALSGMDQGSHRRPTVRELLARLGGGGGHRVLVGTPRDIADDLERWFRSGAADGFVILADVLPDGLTTFTTEVIPILQAKGLVPKTPDSGTLLSRFHSGGLDD